jgi:hypothetical protein
MQTPAAASSIRHCDHKHVGIVIVVIVVVIIVVIIVIIVVLCRNSPILLDS